MSVTATATFSVWSKKHAPEEIGQLLGRQADSVSLLGSNRTPPRQAPDANGWHLVSEFVEFAEVEHMVGVVMARIQPIAEALNALIADDSGVALGITVNVFDARNTSAKLSDTMISELSNLRASLTIDFFGLGSGESVTA